MELEKIKVNKTPPTLGLKLYRPDGVFVDYIDTATELYQVRKDIAVGKVLEKTEFFKIVCSDITFYIDFKGNLVSIEDGQISEIGQIMDNNRNNFVINLY